MYFDIKTLKKIKNKRTGKTKKIWGWVLIICGGCCVIDVINSFSNFIIGLIMVAIGLWLVLSAKKDVAKWERYEMLINQGGNTSIPFLAERMGIPVDKARADVQQMINNNFFIGPNCNVEAYINGEYDLLVMTIGGRPVEPIEDTVVRQATAQAMAKETTTTKGSYNSKHDNPYVEKIREAINCVDDTDVLETLSYIEKSIRRIDKRLKEKPELEKMTSIVQLKTSYLPKTIELVDVYKDGNVTKETMTEIKEMLKTCSEAFKGIENKIFERDSVDTQVDIEVLKRTFEREGLLGSDFDIK